MPWMPILFQEVHDGDCPAAVPRLDPPIIQAPVADTGLTSLPWIQHQPGGGRPTGGRARFLGVAGGALRPMLTMRRRRPVAWASARDIGRARPSWSGCRNGGGYDSMRNFTQIGATDVLPLRLQDRAQPSSVEPAHRAHGARRLAAQGHLGHLAAVATGKLSGFGESFVQRAMHGHRVVYPSMLALPGGAATSSCKIMGRVQGLSLGGCIITRIPPGAQGQAAQRRGFVARPTLSAQGLRCHQDKPEGHAMGRWREFSFRKRALFSRMTTRACTRFIMKATTTE